MAVAAVIMVQAAMRVQVIADAAAVELQTVAAAWRAAETASTTAAEGKAATVQVRVIAAEAVTAAAV